MICHTRTRARRHSNALSDRTVDDISFDAFVSDLETVVDAAGRVVGVEDWRGAP